MTTVYYTDPGTATATNDEPTNQSLSAPFVATTFAAYLTELIGLAQATPELAEAYNLVLKVSRSKNRTNPVDLHNAVLDTGKSYAIFLPDVPDFAYSQVEFFLNAVSFSIEASAPWDYNGTAGGGEANVIVAAAGSYTIDAVVTHPGGTFTVSADIEVN